jgi:hypothetical protein
VIGMSSRRLDMLNVICKNPSAENSIIWQN